MRSIPTALNTHIQAEVISLAKLLRITRVDGRVIRATTHDQDIVVGDETFRSDLSFTASAIQSTDTLSVDNAEVTMGLDGTVLKQADFDNGLYDNAEFDLLFVNWENPTNGISYLKRGTLGDIKINNEVSVTIGLRGLTQYLQKNVVEKYSPTCRVNLGGKKCGVVNSPIRIRRDKQRVRTFDWFLVPTTFTADTLTNNSFEANGLVANGTSGITGWTYASGSYWKVRNDFAAQDGTYYLEGGDDGAGSSTGVEFTLYREFTTSSLGMGNGDVDNGRFSVDFSAFLAGTSASVTNPGRVFIELLDASNNTLKLQNSDYIEPEYAVWEGIGATTFVLPTTRKIRIGFRARKNEGASATVAFDLPKLRHWDNTLATFDSRVYRTMRIPTYTTPDIAAFTNRSFENSLVANTMSTLAVGGWTMTAGSWWRVVTSVGALSAFDASNFLFGGDNGTTTPSQVYILQQTKPIPTAFKAADITAGWYHAELLFRAAKTVADNNSRAKLEFLDAANAVVATLDTGYDTSVVLNTWLAYRINGMVPSTATQLRISLYARSGAAGSAANVGFDNIICYLYPTAYEGASDAETGFLSAVQPTFSTTLNQYTLDGEAVVQTRSPVFGFDQVTSVVDQRSFGATGINQTSALLYSGKVTWLSGANAGVTSFIRIWNNGTKIARLYTELPNAITVGDKFVYALGCDKTIGRCADTFGNAHNFRGEPYLPGTAKVIEFLQTN